MFFFRDRVYVKLADVKELASMRLKLNVYFYKSSTHNSRRNMIIFIVFDVLVLVDSSTIDESF